MSAHAGTTVRFAIIHAVQTPGGGAGAPIVGSSVTGITNVVFDVSAPPTVNADSYNATAGTTLTVAAPGLLANDSASGPMTAAIAALPGHGTAAVAADGSFTYTPNSGFTGSDSFTYTATAGGLTSTAATVTVTVTAAAAPVAIPTLSEWALILTSALIGGIGFAALRRRNGH